MILHYGKLTTGVGGGLRHNTIYRKAYNLNGELIDDEFITENHAITMYEPFLSYEEC